MACQTTLRQLLQRVSHILGDEQRQNGTAGFPEMVRWAWPILADFTNEAISLLASLRPDAFTVTAVITLKPGSKQRVADPYEAVFSIESNIESGPNGDTEGPAINEADRLYIGKVRATCPTKTALSGTHLIENYAVSRADPASFEVIPPVPKGAAVKVCGRFLEVPCALTTADLSKHIPIPRRFEAALVDWILHRAYLIETESEFARGASDRAFNRFYRHIGSGYLQESRFFGEQYLGREEDRVDPQGVNKARGL